VREQQAYRCQAYEARPTADWLFVRVAARRLSGPLGWSLALRQRSNPPGVI